MNKVRLNFILDLLGGCYKYVVLASSDRPIFIQQKSCVFSLKT